MQTKLKIANFGKVTYLELCGKTIGKGIRSISYSHDGGKEPILNLSISLNEFEFMPDGYFDEVAQEIKGGR